jgi:hypothetical protein
MGIKIAAANARRSPRNRRSVENPKRTVTVAAMADGIRDVASVTCPVGQLARPIAA